MFIDARKSTATQQVPIFNIASHTDPGIICIITQNCHIYEKGFATFQRAFQHYNFRDIKKVV